MIHIVFRLDDFSALSSAEMERRVIAIFRECRAALTIGVIPFICAKDPASPSPQEHISLPPDKVTLLRAGIQEGTVDVALHGFSHQTTILNGKTEFQGLPYADQFRKITHGKEALEKLIAFPISTFIPPWNSYDLNTIRALHQAKINLLSAGWNGVAPANANIRFLPATTGIAHLSAAVAAAKHSSDKQPLVVVLFHLYDFLEVSKYRGITTLPEFAAALTRLKSQPDIKLISLGQAVDAVDDLSASRVHSLEAWRTLQALTPVFLREPTPVLLYHETRTFVRALCSFLLLYAFLGLLFILSAICAGISYFAALPSNRLRAFIAFLALSLINFCLLLIFRPTPKAVLFLLSAVRYTLSLLRRRSSIQRYP